MTKYSKGEWTNARYDICEIECDGEIYCTVATKDVDLIIDVLNENEQLKFELKECREHKLFSRRQLEEENEQLKQQKDKWKQQCIHFKEMLDDMDIAYLCDEWIYEELKGDVE